MQDFRQLQVWKKSHRLVLAVYRETKTFPSDEKFGLTSQLRRSAASIPANIAEGAGRGTDSDFRRFLQIAMGSASETEYHLILAADLRLLTSELHRRLITEIQEVERMLTAFIKKLQA